jgi:hypothetical protein
VLGNHDYGDGIAPGDPQPRCREGDPPWKCSAGPLTQVAKHNVQCWWFPSQFKETIHATGHTRPWLNADITDAWHMIVPQT